MNYLEKLPKIVFKFDFDATFSRYVSDITLRIAFNKIMKSESVVFYDYIIKSESIEVLADKLYNDPSLFWVIAFANDMFDLYYDWPFSDRTSFYKYIQKKYNTVDLSQLQRKNWTLLELEADNTRVHSFYLNDTLTAKQYQISFSEYKRLGIDGFADNIFYKTIFDFEEEENETKRYIKIPRAEYIPSIKKELETIFKNRK